jgi:hypothetical protein
MAKFAIADPPYYGRAVRWYGEGGCGAGYGKNQADNHPEAHIWDKPEAHLQMLKNLRTNYDGFAIATSVMGLNVYLQEIDLSQGSGYRLAIWHKPLSSPSGSRIRNVYEPVIIYIPQDRRGYANHERLDDLRTINIERNGFVGAKPQGWVEWVLDLMGATRDDEVDDLFHGSGAVTQALNNWKYNQLRFEVSYPQPE